MKKILLFGLIMLAGGIAKADFETERSKEVSIWISSTSLAGATGTTSYILIDKSDTENWPIKDGKSIHITSIYSDIDKAAASTTTVRFGVVTWIDASSGTVKWFYGLGYNLNVSNADNIKQINFPGDGLNTSIISSGTITGNGFTPAILSTEVTDHSTVYQNDIEMPTINTTYVKPQVGDIIIEIGKAAAAINYLFNIRYYTK